MEKNDWHDVMTGNPFVEPDEISSDMTDLIIDDGGVDDSPISPLVLLLASVAIAAIVIVTARRRD